MHIAIRLLIACLLVPLAFTSRPAFADTPLVIGTANPVGVYHVAGRAICRIVDFPCTTQPSAGSSANLEAIRQGELLVALAQSDLQYHAVKGSESFAGIGPDDKLRAVFSLHSEPFTLVVRRDAGIRDFEDLVHHAVNIGNPGSGQRSTMLQLMKTRGWSKDDFTLVNELPANQQSIELCHGNIDAMVYAVGHPNASVAQAIRLCDAAMVDLRGNAIDRLIEQNPYFTHAWIAGGLYGVDQPAVRTFGVKATLVASEDADPELIYRLVAGVFDYFPRFKASHPALGLLTPQGMVQEGLTAPLHEGALRYYREQGWIEDTRLAKATEETTMEESATDETLAK
ncbi:TAXI family TRAP transporter solute-binding subunit [Pistricoccus aurantiacus]|uniref:TAXI family TRAP transporter solute-binding subunit n=1 Tax=Pistricoccus aurantiacus TaxID=1883414 RepID=A0A5B8SQG0_9GAMM|nr:TAXI family TRAP transporter solute-binding subunit [Pistricoccus aurantiacus]QEA38454.1 TAXI family TRAP transporter solute-binding subunit [Pistricoccus aurantiacus]